MAAPDRPTEGTTMEPDALTGYTDDELDQLRLAVLAEQERRQRLAAAPALVAELIARYEADGGDRADLSSALDGHQPESDTPADDAPTD